MSFPNFILQRWDEQKVIFITNLDIIRRKPGKKAVHDMRVAVKKLRSFLQLTAKILALGEKKQFHSIKVLFQSSGRFRDVEMALYLLKRYAGRDRPGLPSFQKHLRSLYSLTRTATQKSSMTDHEAELDVLTQWMDASLLSLGDEQLMKYIEELSVKILEEVRTLHLHFADNAHAIRKLFKLLYYWLKACPGDDHPALDKKQMKNLDKTLISLGNWQDHFVLGKKLRNFRKQYLVKNTIEFEESKHIEQVIVGAQVQFMTEAQQKTALLLTGKPAL